MMDGRKEGRKEKRRNKGKVDGWMGGYGWMDGTIPQPVLAPLRTTVLTLFPLYNTNDPSDFARLGSR